MAVSDPLKAEEPACPWDDAFDAINSYHEDWKSQSVQHADEVLRDYKKTLPKSKKGRKSGPPGGGRKGPPGRGPPGKKGPPGRGPPGKKKIANEVAEPKNTTTTSTSTRGRGSKRGRGRGRGSSKVVTPAEPSVTSETTTTSTRGSKRGRGSKKTRGRGRKAVTSPTTEPTISPAPAKKSRGRGRGGRGRK